MRCLGVKLALLGMAVAAHAAEPRNSAFFRNPDLPSVQIVQFDSDGLVRAAPYRLTLSIVPIASSDTAPFGPRFGSTSRLPAAIERQKEIAWAENSNLTKILGSDGTSLSPRLRLESNGQRLEIRPRRHSLAIAWSKAFP